MCGETCGEFRWNTDLLSDGVVLDSFIEEPVCATSASGRVLYLILVVVGSWFHCELRLRKDNFSWLMELVISRTYFWFPLFPKSYFPELYMLLNRFQV